MRKEKINNGAKKTHATGLNRARQDADGKTDVGLFCFI